jgi:hypothetical protein
VLEWVDSLEREEASGASLAGKTLKLFHETLSFFDEHQITALLVRALEHIESGQLESRLHGITMLEQIARETEGLAGPISAVLTTFVRKMSPPRSEPTGPLAKIAEDVQAALSALSEMKSLGAPRIDLQDTNIAGADLSKTNMEGAVFSGTCLDRASLVGGYFGKVDLVGASMRETVCKDASFKGANLASANLAGAELSGTCLKETNLERANMSGALLVGADLSGANLMGVIGLTREQISSARIDLSTRLAGNLVPFEALPPTEMLSTWVMGAQQKREGSTGVLGSEEEDKKGRAPG